MGWLLPSVACIHPPTRHSLGTFPVDRPLPLKTHQREFWIEKCHSGTTLPWFCIQPWERLTIYSIRLPFRHSDWFPVPRCNSRIRFNVTFLRLRIVYKYPIYDVALLYTTLDSVSSRDMSFVIEGVTPYLNNIGPALVTIICLVNTLKVSFIDNRFGWDIAHLRY